MKLLMIGDVMGKPGRQAVAALLPALKRELAIDFVIANGENLAAGRGITEKTAQVMFDAGADVLTTGNHIWDQREIIPMLDQEVAILRPANYPARAPGRGLLTQGGVTVLNLQGRTFMQAIDCPFQAADRELESVGEHDIVFVDMHAEATSEKIAMGYYLDGRATVVVGTHTHVPTADAQLLPEGTAFVTDVGMVGAKDSVIGVEVDAVIGRFLTGMPARLPIAEKSKLVQFNSVLIDIDDSTGRALSITRVDREFERDGV